MDEMSQTHRRIYRSRSVHWQLCSNEMLCNVPDIDATLKIEKGTYGVVRTEFTTARLLFGGLPSTLMTRCAFAF